MGVTISTKRLIQSYFLDFFLAETFLIQLLKCLSGNVPSDVKIFVEASFYAAQWTNKNSTVNIQEGQTTQREFYFKTFKSFQKKWKLAVRVHCLLAEDTRSASTSEHQVTKKLQNFIQRHFLIQKLRRTPLGQETSHEWCVSKHSEEKQRECQSYLLSLIKFPLLFVALAAAALLENSAMRQKAQSSTN